MYLVNIVWPMPQQPRLVAVREDLQARIRPALQKNG
jgi:hypothetical protein